jgi:hypothetical protein
MPPVHPSDSRGAEQLSVTMLNTSFGDALHQPDTLDRILPTSEAGRLALVGFSEVTPGVRGSAVAAIESRGYKAIVPEGEGANIDTVWAVSPGLKVDEAHPEVKTAHVLPGRIASRPGVRQRRDAGMHTVTVTTPNGYRVRASTERLAPPILGRKARHQHLDSMATILDEHTPLDPTIDIDVNGGDQNHANGPEEKDTELWKSRGFTPVLEEGTSTYNLDTASRTVRRAGRIAKVLGRLRSMQFDALYVRPGPDRELAPQGEGLASNQIGYTTEVVPVTGTDHHAIETVLTLPAKH